MIQGEAMWTFLRYIGTAVYSLRAGIYVWHVSLVYGIVPRVTFWVLTLLQVGKGQVTQSYDHPTINVNWFKTKFRGL